MKIRLTQAILTLLFFFLPHTLTHAEGLTRSAIEGKWLFTHIVMEGGREIQVNRTTEFLSDGTAVNYGAGGNELSRGTYMVKPNAITYSDNKGEQEWKLVSLQDGKLHVDHRGAEMFFEKQ